MGAASTTVPGEEFARAVRAFFESNATPRAKRADRWQLPDETVLLEPRDPELQRRALDEARRWSMRAFDAGFGWITGPPEYGGAGLPDECQRVYDETSFDYDVPDQSQFAMSRHMLAPAVLEHGTEELRNRYLRGFFRGDVLGCQLFSEPDAGSDLASVRSRAVRVEGGWLVNGQKVWTSMAHLAEVGELLVRTDESRPKHRGLTMFLVDMASPGIEVRPLRQMSGGAPFNEVFLSDVFVPDAALLGGVNDGWRVAITTLMQERAAVAAGDTTQRVHLYRYLLELARSLDANGDALVRDRLSHLYISEEINRLAVQRLQDLAARKGSVGPEMSIPKLLFISCLQSATSLAGRLLGPALAADCGVPGSRGWSQFTLEAPAMRIAGGTDEIMRNVLAERVLGLPK